MRIISVIALSFLVNGLGVVAGKAEDAPPGTAACSGCHPTAKGVDSPAPRILGLSPDAIGVAMRAFRTGGRPATVMDRIAKGFTEDEAASIAAWYGAQKD